MPALVDIQNHVISNVLANNLPSKRVFDEKEANKQEDLEKERKKADALTKHLQHARQDTYQIYTREQEHRRKKAESRQEINEFERLVNTSQPTQENLEEKITQAQKDAELKTHHAALIQAAYQALLLSIAKLNATYSTILTHPEESMRAKLSAYLSTVKEAKEKSGIKTPVNHLFYDVCYGDAGKTLHHEARLEAIQELSYQINPIKFFKKPCAYQGAPRQLGHAVDEHQFDRFIIYHFTSAHLYAESIPAVKSEENSKKNKTASTSTIDDFGDIVISRQNAGGMKHFVTEHLARHIVDDKLATLDKSALKTELKSIITGNFPYMRTSHDVIAFYNYFETRAHQKNNLLGKYSSTVLKLAKDKILDLEKNATTEDSKVREFLNKHRNVPSIKFFRGPTTSIELYTQLISNNVAIQQINNKAKEAHRAK